MEVAADALYTKTTEDLRSGADTVENWRRVLGLAPQDMSDAEIEKVLGEHTAETDTEQAKRDAIERLRWIAHAQNTGEYE